MYLNFEAAGAILNEWNVLFFLLFYNALDLNNQKNLWLPSIYQFESIGTNLDHPNVYTLRTSVFKGYIQEFKSYFQSHHMDKKGKVNCPWSYQTNLLFQMAKNSQWAQMDLNKKYIPKSKTTAAWKVSKSPLIKISLNRYFLLLWKKLQKLQILLILLY